MRKSHFSDEQIVNIMRESHAEGVSETAKKYKVCENAICIWHKNGGTMELDRYLSTKALLRRSALRQPHGRERS